MPKNFLIIGAQRAGTTSLYEYICAHPNVKKAREKEIHFFDWQYSKGFAWYKRQFPKMRGTGCITGEASPSYLFGQKVPARVARHKPEIKLLVLLRDPVMRAYSQYYHNKARGTEPLAFRKALDVEEGRVHYADYRDWFEWSYKRRGWYAEQLTRWFRYFPRNQFHIIKSEDLFANSFTEMEGVFEFLSLKSFAPNSNIYDYTHDYVAHRQQKYRTYQSTVEYLREYFEPYNQVLYKLLDRDFEWQKG